jgi:hypothetical protein
MNPGSGVLERPERRTLSSVPPHRPRSSDSKSTDDAVPKAQSLPQASIFRSLLEKKRTWANHFADPEAHYLNRIVGPWSV